MFTGRDIRMVEKRLRRYIFPNILAMIGRSFYVLADTYYIAEAAGPDGITALNLVLPVYSLIFAIGSMIGVGSATRFSLKKASGSEDANFYFGNAMIWAALIGSVFSVAGIFYSDDILRLMGADDVILAVGLDYTKVVMYFTPFFMLNFIVTTFVRNDGSPNIAMSAVIVSGIFNVVFDYIFMFPMGMGMTGAALATGLAPFVSMGICVPHFLSKKNTIRFRWRLPSVRRLISSCYLGVAAFVGDISGGITTMLFNFILLDLGGNIGVAAYGVIANAALVGAALFNGVAQGMQPLASEAHGMKDEDAEQRIYRHSLLIAFILAVVMLVSVVIFDKQLVAVFNSEGSAELAAYAEPGLILFFTGYLVAAFNFVKAGFFSAIDQGREASVISISRGVAAISFFAWLLSKLFGVTGVWLAFPAAEIFTLLLAFAIEKFRGSGRVYSGK